MRKRNVLSRSIDADGIITHGHPILPIINNWRKLLEDVKTCTIIIIIMQNKFDSTLRIREERVVFLDMCTGILNIASLLSIIFIVYYSKNIFIYQLLL